MMINRWMIDLKALRNRDTFAAVGMLCVRALYTSFAGVVLHITGFGARVQFYALPLGGSVASNPGRIAPVGGDAREDNVWCWSLRGRSKLKLPEKAT